MMLYPAMNKLKSHIPNRYMLVNVVALRARQIAEDAEDAGVQLDEKPPCLIGKSIGKGKKIIRLFVLRVRRWIIRSTNPGLLSSSWK